MVATTEQRQVEAAPSAAMWVLVAGLLALALAAGTLATRGVGSPGVATALRLTARLGFLFFWPSYVGGALASLFGDRWGPLKRRGRVLGMAFTAVLTVHLTLVAWLCWIGQPPPLSTFVIFGLGALCAYVMLAGSLTGVRRLLSEPAWRRILTIGSHYLLFAFAYDFLRPKPSASPAYLALYVPFVALVLLGRGAAHRSLAEAPAGDGGWRRDADVRPRPKTELRSARPPAAGNPC